MLKQCAFYQCRQKYCKFYKECRTTKPKCLSSCPTCRISATCMHNVPDDSSRRQ